MCIDIERRFIADRFGFPIRHDGPVVMPVRQLMQMFTKTTKRLDQSFAWKSGDVTDRAYTHRTQTFLGFGPHAPQSRYWEVAKKFADSVFRYDDESVRLSQIRSDFRQKLVWRYSDGRCQPCNSPNVDFDLSSDFLRGPVKCGGACHIEEGFIDAQRFDEIRE